MVMNEKEIIKLSCDAFDKLKCGEYRDLPRSLWPPEIEGALEHHNHLIENIRDDGYLAMLRHYGKMDKYECIAFCWLVSCWLIVACLTVSVLGGVADNYLINQRETCEILEN